MSKDAQSVMLAQTWDDSIDPTGWWMSEKLDGVRAYWSGSKFFSRQGNEFLAPPWFVKDLPKEPLDGELWCGRGLFSKTLSIIKKTKDPEKHYQDWKFVTYLIFDAPKLDKPYEQRVAWLNKNINSKKETTYAAVVGVMKCTGLSHLTTVLKQVLLKRGEGIMLRKPGSSYEHKRSHNLLKCKYFHDEEAKILGMSNGTGRCKDMMGKLHCELPNGVKFDVGTGFNDAQRRKPPKIGSVITFKYQELSDHGHPRFPVFVRARTDLTWADVLAAARTRTPFSSVKLKKKEVVKPTLMKQHSIMFSTVPSRTSDGKKVVTSDDADEDLGDESELKEDGDEDEDEDVHDPSADTRKVCKYGSACYRTNKAHTDQYRHPDREKKEAKTPSPKSPAATSPPKSPSAKSPSSSTSINKSPKGKGATLDGKLPCIFGASCYRKSADHLAEFSHNVPVTDVDEDAVDLASYYLLKGDEDEEVIKNELSQDAEADADEEEEGGEKKEEIHSTSSAATTKAPTTKQYKSGTKVPPKGAGGSEWFLGCASDEEETSEAVLVTSSSVSVSVSNSSNSSSSSSSSSTSSHSHSPTKSVSITKAEYEELIRVAKEEAKKDKVTISKSEYEELLRIQAKRKREESEKEAVKRHATGRHT